MTLVARQGLHHSMDARGANLEQTRLLHNPTPEIDSIAEFSMLLARLGDGDIVRKFEILCRRVLISNLAEGESEMAMAGLMEDELARVRLTPTAERWTTKRIASAVRDPLAIILDPAEYDGLAFCRAAWQIRDVIAAVPRGQLLSDAVRHELRGRKFALLTQLVEQDDPKAEAA